MSGQPYKVVVRKIDGTRQVIAIRWTEREATEIACQSLLDNDEYEESYVSHPAWKVYTTYRRIDEYYRRL